MKGSNHHQTLFTKLTAFEAVGRAFTLLFENFCVFLTVGLLQLPLLIFIVIIYVNWIMKQFDTVNDAGDSTYIDNAAFYGNGTYSSSQSSTYGASPSIESQPPPDISAGTVVGLMLIYVLVAVVSLVGTGATIRATADLYAGEAPNVTNCLQVGFRNVCRLFCFGLVLLIPFVGLILIGALLIGLSAGILAAIGDDDGSQGGAVIVLVLLLLPVWLLAYFYLMIPFQMAPPSLVLENVTATSVVRRAWDLSSGGRCTIFVATFLMGLINQVAGIIPFLNILWFLLIMPTTSILATVLFLNLRVEKEGLDQSGFRDELGYGGDETELVTDIESYADIQKPAMEEPIKVEAGFVC